MVGMGGGGEGGLGQNEDPLRLVGHLKANKRVAYVLAIMILVHLSNQYDRYAFRDCCTTQTQQNKD